MQGAREAEAANRAARRRRGAGEGELAAAEAEFGAMFVSLAGPAGLLDMEKCLDTAGRMGDAASRSGYGAGARMAASLAGIFADVADIVNRPVDDGAIDSTYNAFRSMMGVLFGAGEEYRSGGDPEPAGRRAGRGAGGRRPLPVLGGREPRRDQEGRPAGIGPGGRNARRHLRRAPIQRPKALHARGCCAGAPLKGQRARPRRRAGGEPGTYGAAIGQGWPAGCMYTGNGAIYASSGRAEAVISACGAAIGGPGRTLERAGRSNAQAGTARRPGAAALRSSMQAGEGLPMRMRADAGRPLPHGGGTRPHARCSAAIEAGGAGAGDTFREGPAARCSAAIEAGGGLAEAHAGVGGPLPKRVARRARGGCGGRSESGPPATARQGESSAHWTA